MEEQVLSFSQWIDLRTTVAERYRRFRPTKYVIISLVWAQPNHKRTDMTVSPSNRKTLPLAILLDDEVELTWYLMAVLDKSQRSHCQCSCLLTWHHTLHIIFNHRACIYLYPIYFFHCTVLTAAWQQTKQSSFKLLKLAAIFFWLSVSQTVVTRDTFF